jgi:hypothetical protein
MLKKVLKNSIIFVAVFLIAGLTIGQPKIQAQIRDLFNQNVSGDDFILSWSTDSYVPPDYEGKALPTRNGHIRVVAIPTKMLSLHPDKYYYRWILDGMVQGWAGGQGKSTFNFQVTKWPGQSYEIESQVLDASETLVSKNTLAIEIEKPTLLLRQENTSYSIIDTLNTATGREVTLTAFPLFFNVAKANSLDWQWQIDGQTISLVGQKDLTRLTVKIPTVKLSSQVQKSIAVTATDQIDKMQQAIVDIIVNIN